MGTNTTTCCTRPAPAEQEFRAGKPAQQEHAVNPDHHTVEELEYTTRISMASKEDQQKGVLADTLHSAEGG